MRTEPGSLGFLKSRQWVSATAFALVLILACALLAQWQWRRLDERQAKNVGIEEGINSPLTPIDALFGADADPQPNTLEWRQVVAEGRYVGEPVLVRQRSYQQANGYWLMSALRTDAGRLAWVVRGWLPPGPDARTPPPLPRTPTGTVEVIGRLRPFESGTEAAGLPAGQVQRITEVGVGAEGGVTDSVYPMWVQVQQESPAAGDAPQRLEEPTVTEGPHLGYAIQWVLFAIGTVIGWFVLVKRYRDDPTPLTTLDDGGK